MAEVNTCAAAIFSAMKNTATYLPTVVRMDAAFQRLLLPLRCERQLALVPGIVVSADDDRIGIVADLLAVQESIDLGIGDPVGLFVGLAGAQLFEVGGGYFLHQIFRC